MSMCVGVIIPENPSCIAHVSHNKPSYKVSFVFMFESNGMGAMVGCSIDSSLFFFFFTHTNTRNRTLYAWFTIQYHYDWPEHSPWNGSKIVRQHTLKEREYDTNWLLRRWCAARDRQEPTVLSDCRLSRVWCWQVGNMWGPLPIYSNLRSAMVLLLVLRVWNWMACTLYEA